MQDSVFREILYNDVRTAGHGIGAYNEFLEFSALVGSFTSPSIPFQTLPPITPQAVGAGTTVVSAGVASAPELPPLPVAPPPAQSPPAPEIPRQAAAPIAPELPQSLPDIQPPPVPELPSIPVTPQPAPELPSLPVSAHSAPEVPSIEPQVSNPVVQIELPTSESLPLPPAPDVPELPVATSSHQVTELPESKPVSQQVPEVPPLPAATPVIPVSTPEPPLTPTVEQQSIPLPEIPSQATPPQQVPEVPPLPAATPVIPVSTPEPPLTPTVEQQSIPLPEIPSQATPPQQAPELPPLPTSPSQQTVEPLSKPEISSRNVPPPELPPLPHTEAHSPSPAMPVADPQPAVVPEAPKLQEIEGWTYNEIEDVFTRNEMPPVPEIPKRKESRRSPIRDASPTDPQGYKSYVEEQQSVEMGSRGVVDAMLSWQDDAYRRANTVQSEMMDFMEKLASDNNNDERRIRSMNAALQRSRTTLSDVHI